MVQLFTNNASSILAATLSDSSSVLEVSDGSSFPSPSNGDYFLVTLTQTGQESAWEIVKCTSRVSNALVVQRGQEGTLARTWFPGDKAEIRLTAGSMGTSLGRSLIESTTSTSMRSLLEIPDTSLSFNNEISITGVNTGTIAKMHVCSGTSADYTVTLPDVSLHAGKLIGFRMAPALTKLVTLQGVSGQLIDGQNTRVMWANESTILLSDGVTWTKIGGRSIPMSCFLYLNSEQTIQSGITTKLLFNTALQDLGNLRSNNDLLIRRASLYALSAQVRVACGIETLVTASLAGSTLGPLVDAEAGAINPSSHCVSQHWLPQGELISCYGSQWSGGARNTYAGSSRNYLTIAEILTW
jgi:hypothetical protein